MLTNVQQDVHNNIKYYSNWGRLEMLFIKPPLRLLWGNFEKLSIKKPCQCNFLGGKPKGPALLEGKLTKGETVIYVCQNHVNAPPLTLKKP
jgi:hypothetical protein